MVGVPAGGRVPAILAISERVALISGGGPRRRPHRPGEVFEDQDRAGSGAGGGADYCRHPGMPGQLLVGVDFSRYGVVAGLHEQAPAGRCAGQPPPSDGKPTAVGDVDPAGQGGAGGGGRGGGHRDRRLRGGRRGGVRVDGGHEKSRCR